MNRPGAEVRRMRSMWDSIETHCFPIDRLAAIVVSHSPYWLDGKGGKADKSNIASERTRLSIEDVVDITRPPPEGIKNMMGYKTKFHAIVGFAYRKEITRNMNPSTRKQMVRDGYYVNRRPQAMGWSTGAGKKPTQTARFSVWFCMRKDGAVFTVSQKKGIKRVLKNLDMYFEAGVSPDDKIGTIAVRAWANHGDKS